MTDKPDVDDVMRALTAPGTAEELSDKDRYLRLFLTARAGADHDVVWTSADQGKSLRTIAISGRVAAVLAASLVAGVGVAAAYTGSLPDGLQSSAHRYIGAQAPPEAHSGVHSSTSTSELTSAAAAPESHRPAATSDRPLATPSVPSVPDLDGIKGWCTAWSKDGLAPTSPAYGRLVVRAGGADQIGAYCDPILDKASKVGHPKKSPKSPKHPKQSANAKAKAPPPGKTRPSRQAALHKRAV